MPKGHPAPFDVVKNNAQLLGQLLKKGPAPLELRGWAPMVGKTREFLATLEQYSLSGSEERSQKLDAQSVPPDQALGLLRLKLQYPVPTRQMTPTRMARLQAESGADAADTTYGRTANVALKDLSPMALAADRQAGVVCQPSLTRWLDQYGYVGQPTNDQVFYEMTIEGEVPDNTGGFMTNTASSKGFEETLGVQICVYRRRADPDGPPSAPGSAGWARSTNGYPEAGQGGARPFIGEVEAPCCGRALTPAKCWSRPSPLRLKGECWFPERQESRNDPDPHHLRPTDSFSISSGEPSGSS